MTHLSGRVLTPDGWVDGAITLDGNRIGAIVSGSPRTDRLIVPGFIDLHCHGGGGADVMDGGDASRVAARLHARHGTTAFLPTTMTSPPAEIVAALTAVTGVAQTQEGDEARILGVHLEGPFISPDRLGAQPAHAIGADLELMSGFMAAAPIRVMTWAPEADPDGALREFLRSSGVRVQIGHTSASYEVAAAAFEAGLDGVTHIFNAMSPLHHRAPGTVGAALAHAEWAEVIPAFLHVHPGAMRAAIRAIPSVYAVTDGTAASGMPDGAYRLGRANVTRSDGAVRLADGTLAGSCLTMDEAFRNLVKLGLSVADAARRTSTLPADYLGLSDRGRIATGAIADLVVLDETLAISAVYIEGRAVPL